MKLTVGYGVRSAGFALPTILLVSTVMLTVLVASIAAAAASRVSLDSQYYNQLAGQAAQSGVARVNECLKANGYAPQWATSAMGRDLRPNSDCTGATISGPSVSAYVLDNSSGSSTKIRTKYRVEAPSGTKIGSILRVVGVTELVRTSPPNDVWRSYEQSFFYRIEPTKALACPAGFVSVPGDSRFNTNDFCVGKYEAKNVNGKAVSQADGVPWINISQANAAAVSVAACTGCHLITEAEWMTVAHNAISVNSNWTSGNVGSGSMYIGHSDNTPSNSLAASTNDGDGYTGTSNTSGSQRRTLRLNNGETIWDLSGNVWEWTQGADGMVGGQPGLSGETSFAWKDYNNAGIQWNSLPMSSRPVVTLYSRMQGVGGLYSNAGSTGAREFLRGGMWGNGIGAGVLTLDLGNATGIASPDRGFRMVYDPLSSIRCPSGFVPVPGNSTLGTKNFCVMKYEAKDVGGIPTSQPDGTPWVNITQTDAIAVATTACNSCRLISDAEWLTIAHSTANTTSNWSGGSVGSGFIYSGHNDASPANALAASADDSNGYIGTGNSSGNQRRTLKLANGEMIWDIAGNVAEWTSGQVTGGQPGSPGFDWRQWNAIANGGSLTPSPVPSSVTPAASGWVSSSHGIGMLYSDSNDTGVRSPIRGGHHNNGQLAGIFAAQYNTWPSYAEGGIGFRVTADPISTLSCSSGMIPVPGDIRFGTTDFCVGKYEAKNVGGTAVSQAAGAPWVSLSQNQAVVAGNGACAKCRLIGEAEWLTIAHNIINVPSNWSGNAVGSGSLYRGHSDSSPASAQIASSNDGDGYYLTGNTSGNQRRTMALSNGQVIWDFAGNVREFTTAQIGANKPGPTGWGSRQWNAVDVSGTGSLWPRSFPSYGTPAASGWNATTHNIGTIYTNGTDTTVRAFNRGGSYNQTYAGIFALYLSSTPTATTTYDGFRVVEIP